MCLFLWSCYQKLHNLFISLSGIKESEYFLKSQGHGCVSVFIRLSFGFCFFFSNLFTTQALFRLYLWYRNMTCVYLCWKRCYIFSSKDFFQLSVGVLCCDPFTWETGGKWIGAYCHTALCRKCGSALILFTNRVSIWGQVEYSHHWSATKQFPRPGSLICMNQSVPVYKY